MIAARFVPAMMLCSDRKAESAGRAYRLWIGWQSLSLSSAESPSGFAEPK